MGGVTYTTQESFAFNTDGGIPTLASCKGCFGSINQNTVTASLADSGVASNGIGAGGIITITAPTDYTTLTISGPGGVFGSTFAICTDSINPIAISPSPSPSPSLTPTPTPSTSPPTTGLLGCVYYSYGNPSKLKQYNPITNTSSPIITVPTNTFSSFADAHTSTKYWKSNQIDTIKGWVPTNDPTTLAFYRTVTLSGFTSPYPNQLFQNIQAIDDNTLLILFNQPETLVYPNQGPFISKLALLNITNNTVTPAQTTPLFNIYAPGGFNALLLTTTNKVIVIGRRKNSAYVSVFYLSQYSYPDGTLELDVDLSSTFPPSNDNIYIGLFESNGNLYMSFQNNSIYPAPLCKIYSINLDSPYNLTLINTLEATTSPPVFNSSINCNTVNLTGAPLTLTLSSTSYIEGGSIADNFHNNSICSLLNDSPAMDWVLGGFNTSAVARYEILCEDTSASNFIHWKVTGIAPTQTSIAQNGAWTSNTGLTIHPTGYPSGDRVNGWNGPCPPSGTNNYRIQVKAILLSGITVTSNYSYFTATQALNFKTIYKYLDIQ